MIEFTPNEEGGYVDQWCVPPTVYLDHWAWRKISESELLTNRFSNALKACGGTLAVSWLNLVEFSRVTDERQTHKADTLLNAILPRAFILDPDFIKVCGKEDKILAGGERVAPHADLVTLRNPVVLKFFLNNRPKPNAVKLSPPENLFSLVTASETTTLIDGFEGSFIRQAESLREDYDNNREFRLRVNRLPKGHPNQYGTRVIASELLGSFLKNKKVKASGNHAVDYTHAVVAVAYCDYVLLDGHWATQVEQARKRIADGGLSFPMAKVFSEKGDGLKRFLQELESGGGKAAATKI